MGYVKRNGIAGRRFASLAELEAHLAWWTREVANRRVHGTTGRVPIEHFAEEEAERLRPLPAYGWPGFHGPVPIGAVGCAPPAAAHASKAAMITRDVFMLRPPVFRAPTISDPRSVAIRRGSRTIQLKWGRPLRQD